MATKITKLSGSKLSDLGYSDTLLQPHIDNGYSLTPEEKIQLDASGNKYSHYKLDASGNYIPDTDAITAFQSEQLVLQGEQIVKQYVQSIVEQYNTNNGVKFESVYNCSIYIQDNTYPHHQFCVDIIAFNKDCWEAGRLIQTQIANGNQTPPTTEAEFIALLPTYSGAM